MIIDKKKLRESGRLIRFLDTETAPNLHTNWRCGHNLNLNHSTIQLERQMISVQWKDLGKKKVEVRKWTTPDEKELKKISNFVDRMKSIPDYNKESAKWLIAATAHTDKYIIEEIGEVINESDLVVGQNSISFDMPWIKGRTRFHKLPPVSDVVQLDTLRLSRNNFSLNSHSLDYQGVLFHNDSKLPTTYDMWLKCMGGDVKTLSDLVDKYGRKDVVLLEQVFLEMLPYCERIPQALGSIIQSDREVCPACGGKRHSKGTRSTKTGLKQRWICSGCGHNWTDTRLKKTTDKLGV